MIFLETNSDGEKSQGYINSGKREGIGAISQYQLMLYAICKKFDVCFYNSGFKNIGHSTYNDCSIDEWSNLFTKFFNFSTTRKIETKISFSELNTDFFSTINRFKSSNKDVLIYLNPECVLKYGQEIINEIYEKEYLKDLKNNLEFENSYFSNDCLNISFHIRAINSEDNMFQEFRELYEYKKTEGYINLITNLKSICFGEKVNLYIHSQGVENNFLDILTCSEENFKIILRLNDSPISDIFHMSHADLLVMANSSYSWISHLMNYNISIVRDNFWHSTYPNTIKVDKNYFFNRGRLKIK